MRFQASYDAKVASKPFATIDATLAKSVIYERCGFHIVFEKNAMMTEEYVKPSQGGTHYTAIIYFHGMGSQRRFEETSRLIDSLDQFLAQSHKAGESRGFLTQIKPQLEPGRQKPDQTFTHIRSIYRTSPKQAWGAAQLVRFHEVYWAPVMAGQKSALGVLKWMGRQIGRPWGTLRSPWRERQRLRRASLAQLYETSANGLEGIEPRDFSMLARQYDEFESPAALREFPEGSFKQFVAFLHKRSSKRPETAKRHERLARAWHSRYRATELSNLFVLTTLALAMVLTAGAAVTSILVLLQRLTMLTANTPLAGFAAEAPATWKTAIGLAISLAGFLGLARFLTDYMGDVEAWATYEETDEKHERRAKVIGIGTDLLAQVLCDERCDRAVLISHSLGTTIAHDTLFSILRSNRARNAENPIDGPIPLSKIDHFVTIGSPIDKIEYFFESYRSPFHRYRRITEYLRGDIGTEPFCRNRKPFIHWINFWDDGDPISGPLHSPTGSRGFVQNVDNVHVANLAFPNPSASHSAYFTNRDVIGRIFEVIFTRAWSFKTLPPREGKDRDWQSAFIGPAIDPPGRRRIWVWLAFFVPWAAFVALVAHFLGPAWAVWAWVPAMVAAFTVALGYLVNINRAPSRLPQEKGASGEIGVSEAAMGAQVVDAPPGEVGEITGVMPERPSPT
jgi:hypothetical protein